MLLKFAKIAGGLRILITETGPIIGTSIGLLSARSVAYVIGFGLSNIISTWLPILSVLISVAGFFNAGSNTPECEAYRAQMRGIDEANRVLMANYQLTLSPYIAAIKRWNDAYSNFLKTRSSAYNGSTVCAEVCKEVCTPNSHSTCGFLCYVCHRDLLDRFYRDARAAAGPEPAPPPPPQFQTYPACSSPDCRPGKKVWTQVLWASPTGNFSDPKGCFIVAFSQDAPTLPVKIEYNPFLKEDYVKNQAISYYLVNGDRYRGLRDSEWKNLESVSGWDKGYWRSESTATECRGWRPGWSKQVK
jgi:hypothetical protein